MNQYLTGPDPNLGGCLPSVKADANEVRKNAHTGGVMTKLLQTSLSPVYGAVVTAANPDIVGVGVSISVRQVFMHVLSYLGHCRLSPSAKLNLLCILFEPCSWPSARGSRSYILLGE
jgi:hypothetical protein